MLWKVRKKEFPNSCLTSYEPFYCSQKKWRGSPIVPRIDWMTPTMKLIMSLANSTIAMNLDTNFIHFSHYIKRTYGTTWNAARKIVYTRGFTIAGEDLLRKNITTGAQHRKGIIRNELLSERTSEEGLIVLSVTTNRHFLRTESRQV